MAFVVESARRIAGGESNRTVSRSQSASPLGLIAGYWACQRAAMRSSACSASAKVAAPEIARRAAATARRAFQGTSRKLLRTLCTIHHWTWVLGTTASMASGRPLSLSTQAMKQSWTPRLWQSVTTESQICAPSLALSHPPQACLRPVQGDAQRQRARLRRHRPCLPGLHTLGIAVQERIHGGERPRLPRPPRVQHRVRDGRNQRRRYLRAL